MAEANALLQMGAAAAVVFAAGACSFPFLHLPRRPRAAALLALAIPVFLSPLLVCPQFTTHRFVVSLMSIMVGVKLYDLHRAVEAGPPPRAWAFLAYLPNDCNLVLRRVGAHGRKGRRADAIALLWLVPITIACVLAILAVWRVDWRPLPWAVEHCAKVMAICAFMQWAPNIGASARRLMGIPASDFSGPFIAAATPAEFWRRWNMPAGRFMHDYIFVPAGGLRHPRRAVLAAFAINGLVHEYVLGIAAGRVLGLAFAFFLVQGLATAATMRLRPSGWARALGIVLTLIFNLAASVLLMACVDAVLPFYAQRH